MLSTVSPALDVLCWSVCSFSGSLLDSLLSPPAFSQIVCCDCLHGHVGHAVAYDVLISCASEEAALIPQIIAVKCSQSTDSLWLLAAC